MIQGLRSVTWDEACVTPPPWIGTARRSSPWPSPDGSSAPPPFASAHTRGCSLVIACIDNADSLTSRQLHDAVAATYIRIHDFLRDETSASPVRFWNYIPRIHAPMDADQSRYMIFNAGRLAAMERIHGGRAQAERRVATATGVGHPGRDLLVYCLAIPGGGRPIENPRQIPAYRYSSRHGPVPPCFSRATAITHGEALLILVGGTAAVRGEDSTHPTDLVGQLEETFCNLDHLLDAARSEHPAPHDAAPKFRSLRAYVVRPGDQAAVRERIAERFPSLEAIEIVPADVCRPELLVEIEGAAEF